MVDCETMRKLAPLELRTLDGRRIGPQDYTSKTKGSGRSKSA